MLRDDAGEGRRAEYLTVYYVLFGRRRSLVFDYGKRGLCDKLDPKWTTCYLILVKGWCCDRHDQV